MKKIALGGKHGRGKFALVDDEDFEELNKHKWCIGGGYALREIWINGKGKTELMHRVINKTPDGLQTDHINWNKLDNRKINLRSCTASQNRMNRGCPKNNSTGVKGVRIQVRKHKGKTYKYIQAQIGVNGKQIHLGIFKTLEEASQSYADAVKKYFGEFGRI